MTEHADLEAISAFVDGEAPEWADHVAACTDCRASAATLRAVAVAVGRPVDPPAPVDRERAITAALAASATAAVVLPGVDAHVEPDRHERERARFAGRGAARPWAMPAAAAVVVGLLGLGGFVVSSYRSSDPTTTFAGPSPELDTKAESGVSAAAPSAPPADLGDVPDLATLRLRAGPGSAAAASSSAGATVAEGRATSSANSGAAADAARPGAMTPTTTLTQRVGPGVLGARPCEEQVRAREPALGPVVYVATARQGPVETIVLGFRGGSTNPTAPVTLLMLAQDGCRELLRAGP